MPEIYLQKIAGVLAPADDKAEEVIKGMKPEEGMKLNYSLVRSIGNHRRFFKFIQIAFDSQDHFDDKEIFRKYLEMKAGHFDTVVTPTGQTLFLPKSIDFASLDETEFRGLFGKVVNAFLKAFGDRLDAAKIDELVRF